MTALSADEFSALLLKTHRSEGYNDDGSDPRPPGPRACPGDMVRWSCPNGSRRWLPSLHPGPGWGSQPHRVSYDAPWAAVLAALQRDGGRWLFLFVCYLPQGMGWAWCADDDANLEILITPDLGADDA